ncbi:hypothetical protein BH24CHL6_BH24CHL6_05610 [soil metagenome]
MTEAQRPGPREGHEELPYVDDRVSKVWVLLIVAVFAAIFAYGVLFGRAGLLTPDPAPSPAFSPSPIVSPAPGASPSPVTSPTPAASPIATPAASPSPPASPSP